MKVWGRFTDSPAKRHESALLISLEDEALDTVLKIDDS